MNAAGSPPSNCYAISDRFATVQEEVRADTMMRQSRLHRRSVDPEHRRISAKSVVAELCEVMRENALPEPADVAVEAA
ncbi:hypothetical protein D3877_29165 [Azospirillum cavernae]|uniref:Uncharacterized protein n=1 Tax=Azospirillum cavernae TaxID=2320860 RepID=A0A418VJW9_9PROT|nr:hypothetical protein [Azospirillum cavernae]RJF76457.1 hypothetical protein D3877_29165 [Azospirillum cavernae]